MRKRALLIVGSALPAAALAVGIGGYAAGLGPGGALPGQPVSISQAQQRAQSFVDQAGESGLALDEILEFQQNFYVRVVEKATGTGAFELLVDRSTGAVGREPGPDMMWNTRYGAMGGGGMMGSYYASGPMTVSAERAGSIAQSWLDQRGGGDAAGKPDLFYGYYTFDYTKAGRIVGMLSVNGYSGQVWYHSWHGAFVASKEL